MAIGFYRADRLEQAFERNAVTLERFGIEAQGILEELGGRERFDDAEKLRGALLGDDDLADVLEVADEPFDVGQELLVFGAKMGSCGPSNGAAFFALAAMLPGQFVLDASYVGSRVTRIMAERNYNETPAKYLSTSPVRDQATIDYLSATFPSPLFGIDPIYGGNRDMVGWKMIGYPGARYDYRDWIGRHNERFPLSPVSITGRPEWIRK